MNELTELARRLVSIDSVNPDLVPGGAGEREIAQFVADWLRGAGLEVETVEAIVGWCARGPRRLRGGSPDTRVLRAGWMQFCWRRPGYPPSCTARAGRARTRRSSG